MYTYSCIHEYMNTKGGVQLPELLPLATPHNHRYTIGIYKEVLFTVTSVWTQSWRSPVPTRRVDLQFGSDQIGVANWYTPCQSTVNTSFKLPNLTEILIQLGSFG